jgi:hypothetical protein
MSKQRESDPVNEAAGAAPRKRVRRSTVRSSLRQGFYTSTFSADEVRRLGASTQEAQDERNLLRTKILRVAKLTPLKKLNAPELEALIKLIRLIAALDALERTGVMARKVDGTADAGLQALAEMDPDDL